MNDSIDEESHQYLTDSTTLIGSAFLFDEIAKFDEFSRWFSNRHNSITLEEIFGGYKVCCITSLHVLGYAYLWHSDELGIERDFLFERAHLQLGDIEKVQSECEAAGIARNFNRYNRVLSLTASRTEFSSYLQEAREKFSEPLLRDVDNDLDINVAELAVDDAIIWAAAQECHRFLIDNENHLPKGLWISDFDIFDMELAKGKESLDGYIIALWYLWESFVNHFEMELPFEADFKNFKQWIDVDRNLYSDVKSNFFGEFEREYGVDLGSNVLNLTDSVSKERFGHLFEDDRVPVVGKEERLKQLLLWEHAVRLDQYSLDKGATFVTLVEGLVSVRQIIDINNPVFVRRFIHPDDDVNGHNYSYAVRIDHPHLLGSRWMKGWITFVRLGTDYSGFGSSQYEQTESILGAREAEGWVQVEEMRISESRFKDLLEKNHGEVLVEDGDTETFVQEPKYAGMKLDTILEGETDKVEYKQEFPGTDKIRKEIAALANTNGGVIVLGVGDDGSIVGVDEPENLQLRITHIATSGKFRPPIYPEFHTLDVSGEKVLLVEISQLDYPCAVDYRYYARVGTSVTKQLYEELKQRFD